MKQEIGSPVVLVVEDDLDICAALKELLEDEGYGVLIAHNGVEALALLQCSVRPCIILLDVFMPMMNGWELVRQLEKHEHLAPIPVVVLTAGGSAPAASHRRVLKKPVQLETLLGVVRDACGEPHAATG